MTLGGIQEEDRVLLPLESDGIDLEQETTLA